MGAFSKSSKKIKAGTLKEAVARYADRNKAAKEARGV
jgi:hypothetical protein